MSTHGTYDEVKAQAQRLSVEELKRLIEELNVDLQQRTERSSQPLYDVLDFEGIGTETWKGVDIGLERASWNG
jgi:uncharacterized protein YhaN